MRSVRQRDHRGRAVRRFGIWPRPPGDKEGARPPGASPSKTGSASMSSARRRQGLVIVATRATAYVASHFFRAANVTIGLDLMRDLAIGPEALGALTGAFFFGFAAMQIPCGFFFDHFGPRRTVAGMLVLATF